MVRELNTRCCFGQSRVEMPCRIKSCLSLYYVLVICQMPEDLYFFRRNKMRSRKASDLQTLGLNELYDMVIFKLSTWDVLWKVKIWRLTVLTRMWKWEWLMVFPSLWHHYMCCVHKLLKPQVLRSLCSSEWFYKTAINNAIEEKMLRSPWVLENYR